MGFYYFLIGVAALLFFILSYIVLAIISYHRYCKKVKDILHIVYIKPYTLSSIKQRVIPKFNWEHNVSPDQTAKEIAANGHYQRRGCDYG